MTNSEGHSASLSSIIIVTWNGLNHLCECLRSLGAQTLAPHEVIVVDNGSADGTVEYLIGHFPQVKTVALPENRGFAGGNNAGLAVATGDYIILLNNDTRPETDWLEHLVSCAAHRPEVGMVASHLTDWEGRFTDAAGDSVNVLGRAHQLHKRTPTTEPLPEGYVFSACAGAALYKREMIDDVGFLDESFFMNVEDSDLAFRAQLRGWKAYFCPRARVRHRVSASQQAGSALNVFYNSRNFVWSYAKNMPRTLIVKYGWLLLADLALKSVVHARNGTLSSFWKGLVAGFSGLPERMTERRRVQKTRTISLDELEASLSYPRLLKLILGDAWAR